VQRGLDTAHVVILQLSGILGYLRVKQEEVRVRVRTEEDLVDGRVFRVAC